MDWSKASPAMVRRVVIEGEMYLDGQLRLATSADQRAAALAGIFIAAAAATIAFLAALATHTGSRPSLTIYIGGALAALSFIIGGICCIRALKPVGVWLPGNQPSSWKHDVESGRNLIEALGEEADHIQEKISDNRTTLERNAKLFKYGAWFGIAAPFIGIAPFVLSFFCRLTSS